MDDNAGKDIAALEREVHELRQQLIRKEAELSRREALNGTKAKLEKELSEVNGLISSTTEEVSLLQAEFQAIQKKLLTTPESPTTILRKVFQDDEDSTPAVIDQKGATEVTYENLLERHSRAKKSALRIILRLLGKDLRDVIRRCREEDPTADLLDIVTYVLHHPSLVSNQFTYALAEEQATEAATPTRISPGVTSSPSRLSSTGGGPAALRLPSASSR